MKAHFLVTNATDFKALDSGGIEESQQQVLVWYLIQMQPQNRDKINPSGRYHLNETIFFFSFLKKKTIPTIRNNLLQEN